MIRYILFFSFLVHATAAGAGAGAGSGAGSGAGADADAGAEAAGAGGAGAGGSSKKWLTLDGKRPAVVARGGFSGLFPASSDFANQMAIATSYPGVILLCNLQLTKDGVGICQEDVILDNTTDILITFENQQKTYNVNGNDVTGYFSIDFASDQLIPHVSLMQSVLSRTSVFDHQLSISTVEDVANSKPPAMWLNVQNASFYNEHKLSVASFIQKTPRLAAVNYISSPEIQFLTDMSKIVNKARTKLIFVFLDKNAVEPTSKQPYGKILEDLAKVKQFASGIVVPKDYILPVDKAHYLEAPTTLVTDAHKLGLEVYASGFANDLKISFNYSYDPTAEYLQFVDNGKFAVDGVVTDFPSTATNAIACFAEYSGGKPEKAKALIISHNGASGVYTGSTDLAYQQAVDDGANVIDCAVQMTKDGVAFCMGSVDLTKDTTAPTTFMSLSTTIPEIQPKAGIFSFDLSWSDVQTLQPQLVSPFGVDGGLPRNPANKNKGKFLTLPEFLEFAKSKAITGILINIENAAYLASKKGIDIVGAVNSALANASLDKQSTQQVLVQSDDSSVLSKFQNVHKRVLYLDEEISDAPKKSVDEIKKYADAVTLTRYSLVPASNDGFTVGTTKVVEEMHAANLSVYVSVLRNEFLSLAFDYYSDPTVEIATYYAGLGVDGIVTEYPATASRYLSNPCSNLEGTAPHPVLPTEAGSLLSLAAPKAQSPKSEPKPALQVSHVVDPPLPAVAKPPPSTPPPASPSGSSGAQANAANVGLSLLAAVGFSFLSLVF